MHDSYQQRAAMVALLLMLAGVALTVVDGVLGGWHWTHTASLPLLAVCALMTARAARRGRIPR